jgi:hypothetical protein
MERMGGLPRLFGLILNSSATRFELLLVWLYLGLQYVKT